MSKVIFDMDPNSHKRIPKRTSSEIHDLWNRAMFAQFALGPDIWKTPHPAYATTSNILDTPSGELLPEGVETAHGVPIDRLRKVSE